jgi:glycosyltransferase involved in cell wall biosynthesis
MDLSIVVPVFRSADCIAPLCEAVESALSGSGLSHELLLVNDGSPDNSWESIRCACARHPFIIGINLRRNVGQDNAIMAGLRRCSGDVVVIMDDDLQHDPVDILRLYDQVRKGHDVCLARFDHKEQSWWKNAGSNLAGWSAKVLIGKPQHLYLSPYKALCRAIVNEICVFDGPYTFIDGIILTITTDFIEVPAQHKARYAGHGNYTFVTSILLWLKLVTSFSEAPLRIISLCGFCISAVSFITGSYFIFEHVVLQSIVPGWTSLIVTVLFLGGLQLVGLGMLGEYVGRTYVKLNRTSQFSIKEIIPRQRVRQNDAEQ